MRWLNPRIGGQKWRVDVVPPDDPRLQDEHEHVRAATFPADCLILISSDLCAEARSFYLWHELEHAVNDVSGAAYEMGRKCTDESDHDAFEERIVRARTSVGFELFRSLGFHFPKGPTT